MRREWVYNDENQAESSAPTWSSNRCLEIGKDRRPMKHNAFPSQSVPKKRKSTGKRLRFSVFQRDHFTCQYCGAQPPDEDD
jgi:hypothetical protein